MAKNTQNKAVKTATAVKKGNFIGHKKNVYTTVHFSRPKTLKLQRNPKYLRYVFFHFSMDFAFNLS